MKRTAARLLLASIGLIVSTSTWAWTQSSDGVIHFSNGETSGCTDLATDAASIMLSRQRGEPPVFVDDEYQAPSDVKKQWRVDLEAQAKAYPIEDTEAKRYAAAETFLKKIRGQCLKAYIEAVPPSDAS
ncbi:MAG: hypothetical protein PW845_20745 [Pseudomonas sp.]|uniref:hypothetical protein n=1 Tax=Pseudomonas abieticivorans TaxID=2931382 RepID=UPI0020C168B6|nr:hypothetical protein [Pseudomonas sp. PIA16]MDE1167731.1 hypothetical protein [Pseudomonas sp.]